MTNNKSLRILLWLMRICVLLTGSPILLFANEIEPRIFGMPFFVFWSMLPSFLITILCIIYSNIANKLEEEDK